MAYDEEIEARIRGVVEKWQGAARKKMFGGVCHLLNGHMIGGVHKDKMILRVGVDRAEKMLKRPHFRAFDITGRPMKGWVMVEKEGFKTPDRLEELLDMARTFVKTLPPKGGQRRCTKMIRHHT